MEQSMTPLYETLRAARRRLGLTQSELAREAKCAQSAISMFESGRTDALSWKTVNLLAGRLNVEIPAAPPDGVDEAPRDLVRLKYCPVDDCPSNIPYVVRGNLHFKPGLVQARVDETTRCNMCGEVLEARCPNESCGAPLVEGGSCFRCGESYVTVTHVMRGPLDQWIEQRRGEIRELWTMSRTRRLGA